MSITRVGTVADRPEVLRWTRERIEEAGGRVVAVSDPMENERRTVTVYGGSRRKLAKILGSLRRKQKWEA